MSDHTPHPDVTLTPDERRVWYALAKWWHTHHMRPGTWHLQISTMSMWDVIGAIDTLTDKGYLEARTRRLFVWPPAAAYLSDRAKQRIVYAPKKR